MLAKKVEYSETTDDFLVLKVSLDISYLREALQQNGVTWVIQQVSKDLAHLLERHPEVLT